jgi:hypothetical protein
MDDDSRRRAEIKSLGDISINSANSMHRTATKTKNASQKLKSLVGRSEEIIFCTTTVFRFRLERYELLIDRSKITVIKRLFLLADNITSISFGEMLSVELSAGRFFGSLTLKARHVEKPIVITYLSRSKAFKAKRLIEGLIIVCNKDIDLDEVPVEELREELIRIGTGAK